MAAGTVPDKLCRVLDSPEIRELIEEIERLRWTGRRGYQIRALVGACLVKSLYGMPTWKHTATLIGEHDGLREVLGAAPSHWALYRFAGKLRKHRILLEECISRVLARLRERHPGLGVDVAIDSTDLPAYANGQKYRYRGGPEREAFSDPDASWGHRSAVSTRKGGGFYGYKLHLAACTATGLPLAWEARSARDHDMRTVEGLLAQLARRGVRPQTAAMDKNYDYRAVYNACGNRGILPVVSKRRNSGTGDGPIDRGSDRFKRLYRARSAVERCFGHLKNHFALTPLRVRRLERVQLHADLCLLTRLAVALL